MNRAADPVGRPSRARQGKAPAQASSIGNQARLRRLAGSPPTPPVQRRAESIERDIETLDAEAAVRAAQSGGTPLPAAVRAGFEARFGHDFRAVRVHADAQAAQAARAVHAKAYASGSDIVFADGHYAPGTATGQHLIAHELAHVIQQGAAPGPRGLVQQTAPTPVVARDADDDEIMAIEAEKLEINALLDRCAALDKDQRDRMIGKVGAHAADIHEERQLACLLAAKFQGVMKRAEFYNTYHELLERLPPNQSDAVLDRVGKAVIGKTMYQGQLIDKRSINNEGMKGAPGSSIVVNKIVYVVVDGGVQFKTNDAGGPAKRNNNPGNITVDDNAPLAWSSEIGAYRGRNTEGRFAVFPTYQRGRAGAIAWAKRRAGLSLLKYFEQYAPSSETGNNPGLYADTVAAAVARSTGGTVTRDTLIQTIMALKPGADGKDPMEAFVDGQEVAEGFPAADVKLVPKDDASLPQEVRDFVAGFDKATDNTNAIADKVAADAAKQDKPAGGP